MKKIFFIIIISLFISPINIFAQDKPEESSASPDNSSASPDSRSDIPFKDRIFVGGSFALSFGSITYVGVAPLIGYYITPKWMAGVGASYYYWKDNYYQYENSIYGGLVFSRYIVYKGLFVEADFEANNNYAYFNEAGQLVPNPQRTWIPSLLLGGGYRSNIGDHSAFSISVLYDVIQNINSQYYRIPVIRAGFAFGL